MSEPDSTILQTLIAMRSEINARFDRLEMRLNDMTERTGSLEIQQVGTLELVALRAGQMARQQASIDAIETRLRKLEVNS